VSDYALGIANRSKVNNSNNVAQILEGLNLFAILEVLYE
jgi:hypothetical protein